MFNWELILATGAPFILSGLFVGLQYYLYAKRPYSPNFFSWQCYRRLAGLELAHAIAVLGLAWVLKEGGLSEEGYFALLLPAFIVLGFVHLAILKFAHRWAKSIRQEKKAKARAQRAVAGSQVRA